MKIKLDNPSEERLRKYFQMLWEMTTPYMRQVWGVIDKDMESYVQRNIKTYRKNETRDEKIDKCLKSLVEVNDWEACPFCGRNQRSSDRVTTRPHDDDCPVKLAEEVIDQ